MVRAIIVRIDNTIRHDLLADNRQKRLGFDIRNHLRLDLAPTWQNAEDRHLAYSSTPSFPFAAAANIGLIDFNGARKRPGFFDLPGNDGSQPRVKVNGRSTIQADQIRSGAGRDPRRNVFKKPIRLILTECRER